MTDLDPQLRDAIARVRGPINARPSLADVHRRARRQSRHRLLVTAGVVACVGVAATVLVMRTDSQVSNEAAQQATSSTLPALSSTTTSSPMQEGPTTTLYPLPTLTIRPAIAWYALWIARHDPAGVGLGIEPADQTASEAMPTPEQFDCTTDACRAMFNYVEWHEIARLLGFHDVIEMQASNPGIDFSQPPHEGDVLQRSAEAASSASEGSSFTTSVVAPTTSNP
jgi:hypothetical protein